MSKWQERIAARRATRIEKNARKKAKALALSYFNQQALAAGLEMDHERRAENKTVSFLKTRFGMTEQEAIAAAISPYILNSLLSPPLHSRLVN